MTSDAIVASVNGSAPRPATSLDSARPGDERLRVLRAEAARLVEEVSGPLKHVALRTGDCAVELTWADPPPPLDGPRAAGEPATTPAMTDQLDTVPIVAPLVGVFYAAPSPGANPFIRPGDRVEANQMVGIIEAMKLMNHIASDVAGIVTEVLVVNGQPVEFGQELVRVRPEPE
jgi:acetyl-CoA carboxylase biotin carboxyl carrier protein